jgi:hypothetical protein
VISFRSGPRVTYRVCHGASPIGFRAHQGVAHGVGDCTGAIRFHGFRQIGDRTFDLASQFHAHARGQSVEGVTQPFVKRHRGYRSNRRDQTPGRRCWE